MSKDSIRLRYERTSRPRELYTAGLALPCFGINEGGSWLQKLVADADWTPALKLWTSHSLKAAGGNPTFRGSCVRDGRHKYRSMEIAGEIGSSVIDKFGWDVNLTEFDLEIVCILYHNFMITGISLADTTKIKFCSRLANEDRKGVTADVKYISTLRPSTTFLMFQLAEYRVGEVFLDSMCGVGTIPIWCAEFSQNRVFALGGELDSLAVGKAGQNAASSVRNADIMQWDATALPLRSQSVDKILIDLPFGVRCGNHRINNKVTRALRWTFDGEETLDFTICGCTLSHDLDLSKNHEGAAACSTRWRSSRYVQLVSSVDALFSFFRY